MPGREGATNAQHYLARAEQTSGKHASLNSLYRPDMTLLKRKQGLNALLFELRYQLIVRMLSGEQHQPVAVQHNVRELRLAAGLSQEIAAERFDLSQRVWQTKEASKNPALLSQGEYELLMLLAGEHPHYQLVPYFLSFGTS